MKQQNDINKQFSTNNNSMMSSYITLIASFIAIVGVYLSEYPYNLTNVYFESGKLLFISILVLIVLAFLSALSAKLGYDRRRDHVVASASDKDDPYAIICGNGREEGFWGFLIGAYKPLFWLFFVAIILYSAFSDIVVFRNGPHKQFVIMCICEVVAVVVVIVVYCFHYCKYKDICSKARDYEHSYIRNNPVPYSTLSKTISININC